ncbi:MULTISPECIES: NYN domain-containing protein [unclassified Amycolatopsis]|uniref:NYN domain-containing protein n=1 Tax=unclassified Amycolatopsis TaxID=2618356 RepID=UPI00287B5BA2|nr:MULTISPECIES: NYN domain-containing protein [unclassified Amycolatopsis]
MSCSRRAGRPERAGSPVRAGCTRAGRDGFTDFTRLAARLRESGLTVYGFGERKTPKPFVAACDKFI